MKKVKYNLLKLSEHHKLFHGKKYLKKNLKRKRIGGVIGVVMKITIIWHALKA